MRVERVIARLGVRQIRTGTLIVVAVIVASVIAVMGTYALTVGSGGAEALTKLARSPALRTLYGAPQGLDSAGGFGVWRLQTFLTSMLAIWIILASTRLLRGDEELGRWDLVLVYPISKLGSTASTLVVLTSACIVCGVAWSISQWAGGAQAAGSLLYGAGLALMMMCFASVAALAAQVFPARRRASSIALGVLGVCVLLRMQGDTTASLSWMSWATPLGWQEKLMAFAGNNPAPLIPLALTPIALGALALVFAVRRDTGAGLFGISDHAEPNTKLLTSPASYAWRRRFKDVIPWAVGLLVYGYVLGGIASTFADAIANEPSYKEIIDKGQLGALGTVPGFVSMLASLGALMIVAYGFIVIKSDYVDETGGRLDLPYSNAVSRAQWNGAQLITMLTGVVVLNVVSAIAIWIGATSGGGGVSLLESFESVGNFLPVSLAFIGLAWLFYGLRPSLTTNVAGGLTVAAFVLSLMGPLLSLPNWLIKLSPYAHLTYAPAEPVAWGVLTGCLVAAVVGTGIGFVGYQRRDLAA